MSRDTLGSSERENSTLERLKKKYPQETERLSKIVSLYGPIIDETYRDMEAVQRAENDIYQRRNRANEGRLVLVKQIIDNILAKKKLPWVAGQWGIEKPEK